ncbi:MAG: Gfo/Idh/MocA family oxidoreductase, partial [Candidatus Hadarchaeales archaeon]
MGRMHARCLSTIPEAEVVAAWSKFPEEHQKFREFTATLGMNIPAYYTELEKMLEDERIDAVFCAIPPRFMIEVASKIVEAGKAALVECPPGSTPEEIESLSKLVSRKGVKAMPGHCYRFAPCFRKARELAENLGKPSMINFREFVPAESLARQWPRGSWIWKRENGGPIPTMTVFTMDLARWLLNSEPSISFSILQWQDIEELGILGYDVVNILRFKNGVVWTNEFSGSVGKLLNSMQLEIICEEGRVLADGPERVIMEGKERVEVPLNLARQERWGHKFQDEYFVKSVVINDEDPSVTLEDAKKALEMSLSILKSGETGLPVKFENLRQS